jgi:hypothetical protein
MFNPPITGNSELDAYLAQLALETDANNGVLVDPNTGKIYDGNTGSILYYLYQYIQVKYADDNIGTNLSNSPTNKLFFGVNNNASTTESTNPADYTWYLASGGFGTTKFLYYLVNGGRQIMFSVSTSAPSSSYVVDSGSAIDLDVVTASTANAAAAAAQATANIAISNAATAQSTADAALSGLSGKLNKSASDILSGGITFSSAGGFKTGTISIDGSGNVTGAGVAFTSKGIAGRTASDTTFTIDATTGSALFKGDINTNGDAVFLGDNPTSTPIFVYDGNYNIDYSSLSNGSTNATFGNARAGVLGTATSSGSIWNAGVVGYAQSPSGVSGGVGIGVVGSSNSIGGYFTGYSSGIGLICSSDSTTTTSFQIQQGRFVWGSYTINQPTGSTTLFLRNDGQWATPSGGGGGVTSLSASSSSSGLSLSASASTGAVSLTLSGTPSYASSSGSTSYASDSGALGGYPDSSWARIFPTNSGTANAGGSGLNILGSGSTGIAGAYVGTSGSGNTVTLTVQTSSPSDPRLKKDITDIDLGLNFVKSLIPKKYRLINDPKEQFGYGFLTTDVEKLIPKGSSLVYHEPDLIAGNEKGFDVVHYPSYIAVLTKAIQELTAKVEALEAKLKV